MTLFQLFPTTENPLQAYPFYQPQYEQVPHDALASSHQWYYHPTLPVAYSHIPSYPHVHNATHSAEVLDYVYSPVPQRPSTSGVQSIPLSAPSRVHVPQTIQVVPKATASYTVGFGAQGCRGVRVSDALKDCVVLDGGDDRVFASIGVRQIRLVVAVSFSRLLYSREHQLTLSCMALSGQATTISALISPCKTRTASLRAPNSRSSSASISPASRIKLW